MKIERHKHVCVAYHLSLDWPSAPLYLPLPTIEKYRSRRLVGFAVTASMHEQDFPGQHRRNTRLFVCCKVAQLHGKKRWLLYPPADTANLYPTRIPYEESSVFSRVDARAPDLDR